MAVAGELLGGGVDSILVDIGEGDGGSRGGKGTGGGQAHTGGGAGDEGDLSGEVIGGVHGGGSQQRCTGVEFSVRSSR